MKRLKILMIVLVLLISNIRMTTDISAQINTNRLTLHAKSAIAIDECSGRVLYEKNAHEELAMASTTKIMTCLIALEYINSQKKDIICSFSNQAVKMPEVKLGAKTGEQYYLNDLLYSLMLESHNDTAVAIAECVAGSEENFSEFMNQKAQKLGLTHTHFVTANGLDADNHYTTAYDLSMLTRYAMSNEQFVSIVNTKEYRLHNVTGDIVHYLHNKNAFLNMMSGACGVKTGYTGNAGYCFVGALRNGEYQIITVVLSSGFPPNKTYKWDDTKRLMTYVIDNYERKKIFVPIKKYRRISVKKGKQSYTNTYIPFVYETLVSEKDIIEFRYVMAEELSAPVLDNQIVGKVYICINNQTEAEAFIYTSSYVKKVKKKSFVKSILNYVKVH